MQASEDHSARQNSYPYTGFWRRFVAVLIDGLILFIPLMIIQHILPVIGGLLLAFLYKPVFEASPLRGTPGKALMDIVVISEDGSPLTLKQAVIRWAMSPISGLLFCMGYLLCLFTEKHQTLHDMVAHSIVVDEDVPDANYLDIWTTQIKGLWSEFGGMTGKAAGAADSTGPRPVDPPRPPGTGNTRTEPRNEREVEMQPSLEDIEKLHKLYQQGAITEEEYQRKKAEWLKKL